MYVGNKNYSFYITNSIFASRLDFFFKFFVSWIINQSNLISAFIYSLYRLLCKCILYLYIKSTLKVIIGTIIDLV